MFLWNKVWKSCETVILFRHVTNEEKLYRHFMQYNARAYTANNSTDALDEVFTETVVGWGVWPPWSPNLNPCNFYLWDMLKNKVYVNNPHSLEDLQENIKHEISCTAASKCVQKHILMMWGTLRSRQSSLQDSFTKEGKLNYKGRAGHELSATVVGLC
jgi:hypothetical protein